MRLNVYSSRGSIPLVLAIITVALVLTAMFVMAWQGLPTRNDFVVRRVAHAGGGFDAKTYTNSYQSLDENLSKGFKYFELDFSFTSDNRLVCIHDWEGSYERLLGARPQNRPTYQQFTETVNNFKGYQPCTLDGLAEWMRKNPSTKVVTDIKERNLDALAAIKNTLPAAVTRVIPQIYQPEDFVRVRALGYDQVVWTLYRYKGSQDEILNWAEKFDGSFAVTMPKSRASTSLQEQLFARRIPTYVHTVNDRSEAKELMEKHGVSEIYTDFIKPE